MTELLRLSWSIARSGWRSAYNRSFRFSRMKVALIFLILQAVFFINIARRAPAVPAYASSEGLIGLLTLMSIQMGWFGIMTGFSRGQYQLYQGILVPLFQISPARPLAFLIGRVIESVPQRAWSTLLWAWVYSGVVASDTRPLAALLLAVFGLMIGMVAHLTGVLLLAFWNRYSPRTVRNGMFAFGALTLALATWAIIYLSQGGTVTELALAMRTYRLSVGGTVLALAGLPGLFLLLTLLVRPGYVEDLYRQGVYNVVELGEADVARPSRSVWLPIPDGVLRAVLSREWLQLARARVTRVQFMIWVAGTVGIWFAARSMTIAPIETVLQYVGALSLAAWFLAYGHWVVRVFEAERMTIRLYRLTAVSTWKLLLAKFIAVALPSLLLVMTSATVGCLAAECRQEEWSIVLGWTAAALIAGVVGGFGIAAATAGEEPEEQEIGGGSSNTGAPVQAQSGAWWVLARTLALIISMVLPIWTGAGQPGLEPFHIPEGILYSADLLLPVVLLVGGSWVMIRVWEAQG